MRTTFIRLWYSPLAKYALLFCLAASLAFRVGQQSGVAGYRPLDSSVNIQQVGGTNVSTGTGAGGAGIPRVTVSNDSTVGLVAGTAVVGKVGIDQTTPGTSDSVTVSTAQGAGANMGLTTDAAVSTDANGTLNAHMRGVVKLLGGTLTTAPGAASTGGLRRSTSATSAAR